MRWRSLSTSGTPTFISVPNGLLAGTIHDTVPDQQSAFPVEVLVHTVLVGLV